MVFSINSSLGTILKYTKKPHSHPQGSKNKINIDGSLHELQSKLLASSLIIL